MRGSTGVMVVYREGYMHMCAADWRANKADRFGSSVVCRGTPLVLPTSVILACTRRVV